MAIIGENDETALGGVSINSTTPQWLLQHSSYIYQAGASEEVFKLGVYIGGISGDGAGVDVAVYDLGTGPTTDGASLVAQANISSLTINSWNTTTITPVALTSGNYYAIAFKSQSSTNVTVYASYTAPGGSHNKESSAVGSGSFPSSWTAGANGDSRFAAYAETQTATGDTTVYVPVTPQRNVRHSGRY